LPYHGCGTVKSRPAYADIGRSREEEEKKKEEEEENDVPCLSWDV
jgi:hypothetical protein